MARDDITCSTCENTLPSGAFRTASTECRTCQRVRDQQTQTTTCSTCFEVRPYADFYAGSTECKPCKRQRSQENRVAAAGKVLLADRLLDVLERLAEQGRKPESFLVADAELTP